MDIASSYYKFKQEVKEWVYNNFDSNCKILDVGPGSGTYYKLLHDKFKNMDGVEIYEPNIIDYNLREKYNNVYNKNIIDFEYDYYDLIIFGDIIEHLTIEDAQKVLDYAYNRCKNFIVAVPYCLPQDENENKYEKHIQDDLTIKNIQERYPYLKLLYGDNIYGYYIKKDEKIIISLTSWKKRLTNIPIVLDSIYNQTIKPDKIVLNLSSEEFENKEGDIPVEVLDYIRAHDNIQINWIVKNIRSWKKTIPTFKLYPNDCIICIDDDMLYPNDFIERLWNKHLEYPNNPITFNVWTWPNGFMQHFGAGSLDKKCFYEDGIEKWLETEITNFSDEDSFMTFMAVRHGNPYISAGKIELQSYNSIEPIFGKDGGKAYYWIANKLNDRFENYIQHKNGDL